MTIDYSLQARTKAFDLLINQTHCTDQDHQIHDLELSQDYLTELFIDNKMNLQSVYFIGNGGSAAVASHAVTDFVNGCQQRAFTLHDSSLLSCMTNDYGHEQAFTRILNTVFKKNDILVAVSSSGKSMNICNAAIAAKSLGGTVITLTGFQDQNPLRKLGDRNFWINSSDYGLVEIGHLFLLHNLAERVAQALKKQSAPLLQSDPVSQVA